MATLENIREESDGEIDEFSESENDYAKIPDGLPGSEHPRKPPGIRNSSPEQIGPGTNQSVKRKPGRPAGSSATKKSTGITGAQNFWTTATALVLNLGSAFLAAKILRDRKYVMTEPEARSAASACMLVAFKYKAFRDIAVVVNADNDFAVVFKGFWPYLNRVFFKEIIEDVITGLFVSKPRQSRKPEGNRGRGNTDRVESGITISNGNSEPDGVNGQHRTEPAIPEILSTIDWRAD